jgi:hypothetical protein
MNEFDHLYHGEHGLIVTDNELIHYYLMKQGYFQMKYKFTKSFTY